MTEIELVTWYYTSCNQVFATKDPQLMAQWADVTADDLIYQNKSMDVVIGKRRFLDEWVAALSEKCESVHIAVQQVAADGEWVLNQRFEEWTINGVTVSGDVMGLAHVRDGKIAELYDFLPHFEQWRRSGQLPEEFFTKFGAPQY